MSILKMMPHRLEFLVVVGEYEDCNGDFHPGEEKWIDCGKCDAVPSGRANKIPLPDGELVHYTYAIHLPKSSRSFAYGDKIRISFYSQGVQYEQRVFTVKGFHRYQLKCMLWV